MDKKIQWKDIPEEFHKVLMAHTILSCHDDTCSIVGIIKLDELLEAINKIKNG